MKKTTTQKQIDELLKLQSLQNCSAESTRARSITVGTAFGGVTEVSMRRPDGQSIWCVLQPVETIELLHQLAANAGCHISVKPRDDFASWRNWRITEAEKLHLQGHPPFPNSMAPHMQIGANLPPPEQQPGFDTENTVRSEENVVAIKKTINRRNTKRASKAS